MTCDDALRVDIREATIADLSLLMEWRERVVREVFDIPTGEDIADLMESNRRYYEREIPRGRHIACFALLEDEIVGCGAICLQDELPSPDNPTGINAYLMNVFTRRDHRGRGIGSRVVSWLLEQAQRCHAGKVYLESTEYAESLYLREGFVPMEHFFRSGELFSNLPSKRPAGSCYE